MKDTMQTLKKLPKGTLLPALGLIFFVVVALAGVGIAQFQQNNRGPVAPNAAEESQASGGVCTTSWIAKVPTTPTPTPPVTTPTPTPGTICEDCNYQVDAFWGEVIRDFRNNVRYENSSYNNSQGTRLIAAKHDRNNTTYPGCQDITLGGTNIQTPALPSNCSNPVGTGKLTATPITVNEAGGYAHVKISNRTGTASVPGCTYKVGLVSYKANWSLGVFEHQQVNDLSVKNVLYPQDSIDLIVKMPMNNDGPQCHNNPISCPAPGTLHYTQFSFAVPIPSPTPTSASEFLTRVWNDEPSEPITYNGTHPLQYTWTMEKVELPGAPNVVYATGTGWINRGETLQLPYPPRGQWGQPDSNGAYEVHGTINFEQVVNQEHCQNMGFDWDRWYHNQTASVTVKNPGSTVRQFEVRNATTNAALSNNTGATRFTVPARGTTTMVVGLPEGAKSVRVAALGGDLRSDVLKVTNTTTRAVTRDLAGSLLTPYDTIRNNQYKTYTW